MDRMVYYKITNQNECHHGYQYYDGLNILPDPFAQTGSGCPGGFYFTDIGKILEYARYNNYYLREVILPVDDPEFQMVQDQDAWRANRIILGRRWKLSDESAFDYLWENQIYRYANICTLINWVYNNRSPRNALILARDTNKCLQKQLTYHLNIMTNATNDKTGIAITSFV